MLNFTFIICYNIAFDRGCTPFTGGAPPRLSPLVKIFLFLIFAGYFVNFCLLFVVFLVSFVSGFYFCFDLLILYKFNI